MRKAKRLEKQFISFRKDLALLEQNLNKTYLRNLANNNPIVSICINKIKNKIRANKFLVKTKDPNDDLGLYKNEESKLLSLLNSVNEVGDSWQKVLSKVVEDILIFDFGVIEKQRNASGEIVGLYHVDGSTIKALRDEYGNILGYEQWIGGTKTAEFLPEDLLVFQNSPKGEVNSYDEGRSPVQAVLNVILASLKALAYNIGQLTETSLPPALANLKGMPTDQLISFAQAFIYQIRENPHQIAFTNADSLDIKLLRPSNSDMEFMELNTWFARLIIAAFGLSPIEFGILQDSNRANAEVQKELQSEGISDLLFILLDELNSDLINDFAKQNENFAKLEFYVPEEKRLEKDQVDNVLRLLEAGIITQDEARDLLF